MRLFSFSVMASLLLGLLVAAPAQAAGGSTAGTPVILYSGCQDVPYSYSVTIPPGSSYWSLSVKALTPDGLESTADIIIDGEPTSGVGTFFICSNEMPGTWSIVSTLQICDAGFTCTDETLPASTFPVRQPFSKTTLVATPRDAEKGQVVRLKVTVKDERPNGYFPAFGARLRLEEKRGGRWVKVRGASGFTSSNGKDVIKVRYFGTPTQLRVVATSSSFQTSISKAVAIR